MGLTTFVQRVAPDPPTQPYSHFQDGRYAPLLRAYSQTPIWLVTRDDGRTVATWMVFETPGDYLHPPTCPLRRWLDVHLVALNGPVLDPGLDEGVRRAVIGQLLDTLRRLVWRRWPISVTLILDPDIPLQRLEEWRELATAAGYRNAPRWTYLARLPDNADALAARIKPDRRTKVRKAEKAGLSFSCQQTEAALRSYYQVRAQTLARNGHASIPLKHFLDTHQAMEGTGIYTVFLATQGDRIGAGQLAFTYNGYVHLTGVSIADWCIAENVPANDFLQWNILHWALDNGCHSVDFVGAAPNTDDPKIQAIDQFKSRWGTELVESLELRLRTPPPRRGALYMLDRIGK